MGQGEGGLSCHFVAGGVGGRGNGETGRGVGGGGVRKRVSSINDVASALTHL